MEWFGISGSWRNVNEHVSHDIEQVVFNIIHKGNGIITGGALGVDYVATQTVLERGDARRQVRIFLPISLKDFHAHYLKRAREGVITNEEASSITSQLRRIYELNESAIIDDSIYEEANVESYYARNTRIVQACEILYAFQINNSLGTQDAVNKARQLGKKVIVKKYTI